MENLHRDILDNILSRLPNKSILHFKLVCKTWRALLVNKTGLLYSEFFYCRGCQLEIQFHYGKDSGQLFDYNEINIKKLQHGNFRLTSITSAFLVGSCNGLVCLEELHEYKGKMYSRQVISICNPFTGEFINLPGSRKLNLLQEDSAVGFGYIPATNEYKIVRIHYTMAKEGRVQVYTLGSNLGWRDVGRMPFFLPLLRDVSNRALGRIPFIPPLFGVFANGAVYWLVDLTTEKFKSVTSPPLNGHVQPRLLLLGEYLCLVLKNAMYDWIDIWVFQKKMDSGTICEAKQNRHERYYDHQQEYYYDNVNTWGWSKEYSSIPFVK
ncbi:F-box protein At3g07870-like [Papaver somniferum]|uniref:F-box protein At3g07870-like n=1 Tax=Papaver somniferum TaxID=3469 RepID=UPI000E6F8189|nr:F-box protein At3g07870-like [Papaver somniferum]